MCIGSSRLDPEGLSSRCSVLVLLSGGIDSTACVYFYLAAGLRVNCLFIDYGQVSACREWSSAQKIAAYFHTTVKIITCNGTSRKSSGEIVGRNAFLLTTALLEVGNVPGIIAIGVHAGTSYQDCSAPFIKSMQNIYDDYTSGQLKLGTPFLEWSKRDIWEYCKEKKVPLHLTYSCELGREQPCGACSSCADLEALYAG